MKIRVAQHHLDEFLDCREKFNLRENYGLQLRSRKKQLDLGSAFHRGVAMWKRTRDDSQSLLAGAMFLNGLTTNSQEEHDQLEISKATLFGMLNGYFERYRNKKWEFLHIEKYLEASISQSVKLVGTPDAVQIKKIGLLMDEEKTTSAVLDPEKQSDYVNKLPLDLQVSFYFSLIKHALNKPLAGVTYRVIRVPAIRRKKNQTLEQYCKEIAVLYLDAPDEYFFEIDVMRSTKDMEIFEYELKQQMDDLVNCYRNNHWYKHSKSCSKWGCEYIRYCTNPTQETLDAWYTTVDEPKRCFAYINKSEVRRLMHGQRTNG